MKEITMCNESMNYKVYIDNTMDKFHGLLEEYKIKNGEKLFILTDDMLFNLYNDNIERFGKGYNHFIIHFENGEQSKNMNTILKIYDFLLNNNADKNSVIIAFGGGVIRQLAAFSAATFMGGIRYIVIPTTLISMIDSRINGIFALNYREFKNVIGSSYVPIFEYISINFLKSLSSEHFSSGFGEVIKYGIIRDKSLLNYINENSSQIIEKENDRISYLIRECLNIKSSILKDECKDNGIINILSFGHTIGQAIENDAEYSVLHGNAIALGILVALKLSEMKLGLSNDIYMNIEKLYKKLKLPTRYKVDNFTSFLYAIKHNKKNNNGTGFILLEQIGKCRIRTAVSEEEIIEAIKFSISRGN